MGYATMNDDGSAEVESSELVTIRTFQSLDEAFLAKGGIESAGIECFLADAYVVGRVGRVRLQVQRADVKAANEILDQPIPESFEVDGVGQFEQPRCPACRSLDVSFEGWTQSVIDAMVHVGLPGPYCNTWKCQACQHSWRDSSLEA